MIPTSFNPLRGIQALQHERVPMANVSIRWGFNPLRGIQALQPFIICQRRRSMRVSILYEAFRLCNKDRLLRKTKGEKGFNPLRGIQALQLPDLGCPCPRPC